MDQIWLVTLKIVLRVLRFETALNWNLILAFQRQDLNSLIRKKKCRKLRISVIKQKKRSKQKEQKLKQVNMKYGFITFGTSGGVF